MLEKLKSTAVSGVIPQNSVIVTEFCRQHPTNSTIEGALCRNKLTGNYFICIAGGIRSVPQDWAVAEEIKEIRRLAGLSQQKFSEMYDIPCRTVENWESKKSSPPIYVVELLRFKVEADLLNK